MTALVEREGSVRAAGHAYAAVRRIDPASGARAFERWTNGTENPRQATTRALLMAKENDRRTEAERDADVDRMAERFASGCDLWTGRPAAPRRSLEDLALELAPLDEQLRAQAFMADRREERQEARGGRGQDDHDQEDEDKLDVGSAVLRLLRGGVA